MGFILIGIIIAVLLFLFACRFDDIYPLLYVIVLSFFGGIVAGLFVPTGGYKPIQEVQTIELHALSNQTTSTGSGSIFYVSISANNVYTYYTQIDSEFADENSKAYISRTISGDNITIIEEENCQTPRLTIYTQDAYSTFWSFGLGCQLENYVFYVPKGTIAHEIALG